MTRILIIEDDLKVAQSLELYLRAAGHTVVSVHDGVTGLEAAESGAYDLVILDLMLPGMYGMDVCRQLRESSDVPVMMLTARTLEDDQIRGLELGADDYITKPFSPRQVVARVASLLRRNRRDGEERVRFDGLELDCRSGRVSYDGKSIVLTPTETRVLRALIEARSRVVTREEIVDRAFDGDASVRTIDVHIKNLRHKLGAISIATVFGRGYQLAGEEEPR